MKPVSFSLLGRSGCGKGTQADLLIKHFGNLFYFSSGDLLRDLAKLDTTAGKKVKKTIESGELVPELIITGLWLENLCTNLKDGQGVLFDGAPRKINEAKNMDDFLDFLGIKENFFTILLDIPKDEAFSRLTKRRICRKCGKLIPWIGEFKKMQKCPNCDGELFHRQDDNRQSIENRLDFFDKEVSKTLDYYKEKGRLITINGDQSIEKVFQDILKAIDEKLK